MDLFTRLALAVMAVAMAAVAEFGCFSYANVVTFDVKHKFPGKEQSLSELRAHDILRHGRILSTADIDLPIGGNGQPYGTGIYFAKIGLGTPSKDFYVLVDTGSDLLWVNCAQCDNCPTSSSLGIPLTEYDPMSSSSSSFVYCDQNFCTSLNGGKSIPNCQSGYNCIYALTYGDRSATGGLVVEDTVHLQQVTGNLQTTTTNGTIAFGCSLKQAGRLTSSDGAADGILGFGQADTSMLSQLAKAGKVKKTFSHCLDNIKGGGIFAIGELVSPKVNATPMVPNQAHYTILMKAVEVGNSSLQVPSNAFEAGAVVDSGTTLAYLPSPIYEPLITQILAQQPGLKVFTVDDQLTCFQFSGNVDDGFPVVKFHFGDSLVLPVYPHDYLFQDPKKDWCIGWQNSSGILQTPDGKDLSLLGDLVLSNKLVLYDVENQTIGWTEYKCSSSINVKDANSEKIYSVGAHNIAPPSASASSRRNGEILTFLSILIALLHGFTAYQQYNIL